MPVHHSHWNGVSVRLPHGLGGRTDLRYATPSPATAPCSKLARRPFFLKTKLEPMRRPEVTARITPADVGQ